MSDFTRTWRYKLGLGLIITGHLVLAAALLMPLLGVSAGTIGVLVITGEALSLSSIVFLGKDGFKAIKTRVFAFIKQTYTAPVGRIRHTIGITLFLANGITTYIIMIYAWRAFNTTLPDQPPPPVWGLDLDQQGDLVFGLFFFGEAAFLLSIWVLGADWWERFRRVIVWQPENEKT